jgi:hypothetical protein
MTSSPTTWWCVIPHAITTPKHVFTAYDIRLQWEKQLENGINDFKND